MLDSDDRCYASQVPFAIRTARREDWAAMQDLFARAGQAAWDHILDAETLADLAAPERWNPGASANVFVSERQEQVIGFACVRPSADPDAEPIVGEIDALYVLPSEWGNGVGQALLTTGVRHLAVSGFKEATLWTERRNHRPLRFYQAAGWRLDGAERRRLFRGTELIEL
jgi:GNAT superfamily N-acetyltransferase